MSGWDFLAGFANTLGGTLQQRQQNEQAEKLRKMQEDAAMKRDMFLAEYRAKVDAENRAAEREATKNDVTAQFTDPETGSVYGRTKGGGIVPLHETSEEYRQSLRDKTASDIEYKKAQRESAEARAERARRPSTPRPRAAPKPPKPEKVQLADLALENNAGKIKVRPADAIGPAAPASPFGDRPELEMMPNPMGTEPAPIFVDPSKGTRQPIGNESRSPTQPNAPSVEEIIASANKAVAAGADPAKVEARMAQLMKQFGYVQ